MATKKKIKKPKKLKLPDVVVVNEIAAYETRRGKVFVKKTEAIRSELSNLFFSKINTTQSNAFAGLILDGLPQEVSDIIAAYQEAKAEEELAAEKDGN